jgi:uncharacterized membrane protein
MTTTKSRTCKCMLAFGTLLAACSAPLTSPRVLVVDDQPTWSWRYLSASLRHDAELSVSSCLVGSEVAAARVPFPASATELAAYDVIICGDFAVPGDDATSSAWWHALSAFVRAGGGVIFECGPESSMRWQRPEIAALLPVQLATSTSSAGPTSLCLADDAPIDFAGTLAGEAPAATFAALAPISHRPVVGLAPSARVIAVDVTHRQPVLASMEVGAGRTVWVGSDETWRWRDPNPDLMASVWARLVRFAAAGRR